MKRAFWETGLVITGLGYIVLALFGGLFSPGFGLCYVTVTAYVLIAGHRARHKY
jgi:hypothetical protein